VERDSLLLKRWFLFAEKNFQLRQPSLLAVSGGMDSMVMLHLFHEFKFPFAVAHVNFQLRGEEANKDEIFVRGTCEKLKILFFSLQVNTKEYAAEKNISIEMAARELRYGWLEELRKKNGYHNIATAHHLDDSIETVLLNIFHGTGIRGLSGIPLKPSHLIRPMMCFFRNEIERIVVENQISYQEDQTNKEIIFQRNQIRNEIIPSIEKYFPSFKQAMAQNISHWGEARIIYEEAMERKMKKIAQQENDTVKIAIDKIRNSEVPQTILFELLKDYGFNEEQVIGIFSALGNEPGKIFYSATHRLLKDRTHLILSEIGKQSNIEFLVERDLGKIEAGSQLMSFERKDAQHFSFPKDSSVCCLDLNKLEFPLILRHWKKGDYFYPLGMKRKKKKVSDFLIDQKVPLTEKPDVFIAESGKKIACIVGLRIDERFKVLPSTQNIFIIKKKQA
jgi:tRNA(Ile)-lysidine synthase